MYACVHVCVRRAHNFPAPPRDTHGVFVDAEFPPEPRSVGAVDCPEVRENAYEWRRASDLYGESAFGIVRDGFAPDDVAQVRSARGGGGGGGGRGVRCDHSCRECLGTAGSSARCPWRRATPPCLTGSSCAWARSNRGGGVFAAWCVTCGRRYKDVRRDGTYAVRLWQGGRWVCIVVDDRFPVVRVDDRGAVRYRPLFARPREADAAPGARAIWMMIVEKAFAKAYGSYAILNGGSIGSGACTSSCGGRCVDLI